MCRLVAEDFVDFSAACFPSLYALSVPFRTVLTLPEFPFLTDDMSGVKEILSERFPFFLNVPLAHDDLVRDAQVPILFPN